MSGFRFLAGFTLVCAWAGPALSTNTMPTAEAPATNAPPSEPAPEAPASEQTVDTPATIDTPVTIDTPALPEAAEGQQDKTESTVKSLEAFYKTIQSKEEQVESLRQKFQAAVDDVTRNQLLERLKEATEEAERLNRQFEEFAVAVDLGVFVEEEQKEFNWQDELASLLRPIVAELKNATAETRIIGELRSEIEEAKKREETAAEAVENLERLLAADPGPELQARLETDLNRWSQRRDDARNRRTALEVQLQNRLADRKSVLDETTSYAKNFFRTRGLNLLLGVGAFLAVFFGVRLLGRLYDRMRPTGKGQTFSTRLGALLFQLVSVLGGLAATLLVFNMVGDWFLLGILLIFLLGVGWASINTLPNQLETIKLMLNVGSVKEDERLVFAGTPWCVESLAFSARLVNPLLDGGVQVLPVKHLVGMHSRPNGEKEEWFPCRPGDWVELADGRIGRVSYQTPSAVQIVELGGSQVVYQTPDFLALSPRNLSTGFRITTSFGVDYQHQAQATTAIPQAMQQKLEAELPARAGAERVQHVRVEFSQAAASSLDYEIEVDLAGEAAPKLPAIRRAIPRLLVDACNENGWVIPFQQVTVHHVQPAASGAAG